MRVRSVAAAAASVAVLTVFARLAGFGRLFAFSQTIGDGCLGTIYQTANQVPNVVFEIVAGGALAGVLVPLLSSRLASDDPAQRAAASKTASAALTWSVGVLVVVSALLALVARPVVELLLARAPESGVCTDAVSTGVVMLWVFLPQIPLYAVAVVFAGALQAQQRFTAPAAAPLVSSLVVGATYLVVGGLAPAAVVTGPLADLPTVAFVVLTGGTTVGVLALALTHVPALRSAVRWRPTLRPAAGDGARLRSLALSGLAVLLAQQVVAVAITVLVNVETGAVARWSYAWAMFLLPYAVLAVPVATAVFPRLAKAADEPGGEFAALLARSVRTVLLVSSLGAAVLVAVAAPVAVVFVVSAVGSGRTDDLTTALVVFAPGLLGYGLVALLTRALYTLGAGRAAAAGAVSGWALTLVVMIALTAALPDEDVLVAVALAHSLGFTLAGILLLRSARAATAPGALTGLSRAVVASVVAAVVGGAAGGLVGARLAVEGTLAEVGLGILAAVVAGLVWAVVARLADGPDVRLLTGSARSVLRR